MKEETFDRNGYLAMLRTSREAGIPALPLWRCAQLAAIVHIFADNESITHCPKLLADLEYIKETYHIDGGETPDKDFVREFRQHVEYYERYCTAESLNRLLRSRYGIEVTNL